MTIKYNLEELKQIMWSFHTISGIRFILFDAQYNKVLSYPENECAFCSLMRKNKATARKCNASDKKALERCNTSDGAIVYKCHAGLTEAALALKENDNTVGYLMFGQVTDNDNKGSFSKQLYDYCTKHKIEISETDSSIEDIMYIENNQILAAAKIMEACTSYIILKELIIPDSDKIFVDVKEYIENNLEKELDISALCDKFDVSRTKLYDIFQKEAGAGIAEYTRKRRVHRAKKLLKTTNMPVWEIAQSVGFSDYTYFGRVYKKYYGSSPRDYRKK